MKSIFTSLAKKKPPEERLMRALIRLGIVCEGQKKNFRADHLFREVINASFGSNPGGFGRPMVDTAITLDFFLCRHGARGGVEGAIKFIQEERAEQTRDGKNLDLMIGNVATLEQKVKDAAKAHPPGLVTRGLYYIRNGIK